jgi:DNA-directed RNA polymerase specialized sigma subunit
MCSAYSFFILTNIKYILEKNQIAIPENFDKEKIELILDILNQMKDKRMSKIFKLRYFNKTNKVLSWNAIGKKLKISTQTAINIHNKALKLINTKLNSQNCFDKI